MATGLATAFKKFPMLRLRAHFLLSADRTLPVDVLVGCCSMIRRETFNDVGLLDGKPVHVWR